MKGVILAGGTGSRLYPLTRITNKHLLPIYDRPMIAWAIEAVVQSGIDEIMLVTGGTHAGEFLRLLGNGHEYGINQLSYGYQENAGGIAEALGLAAHFAEGGPVLVMLADNIVERSIRPIVDAFRANPVGARILLSPVSEPEHLRHLGVPVFGDDGRVVHIEEKPEIPATSSLRDEANWRSPTSIIISSRRGRWLTTYKRGSGAMPASPSMPTTP
jgi:glucose-1-phosphate thymidylyltransferase